MVWIATWLCFCVGKFIDSVNHVNLALAVFHFYNNLIIYIFSSVQNLLLKMLRTYRDSYLLSFPNVLENIFCKSTRSWYFIEIVKKYNPTDHRIKRKSWKSYLRGRLLFSVL